MAYQALKTQVYGAETLEDVVTAGKAQAKAAGAVIDFFQR